MRGVKMLKKYYLSLLIGLSFCQSLSASEEFPIEKLPKAVLSNIVSFLDVKEVLKLSQVNKKFYNAICKEPSIYQKTSANNLFILDFQSNEQSYSSNAGEKILTWNKIKDYKNCGHILKYYVSAIKNVDDLFCSEKYSLEERNIIAHYIHDSKNILSIEYNGLYIGFHGVDFKKCAKILSLIKLENNNINQINFNCCDLSTSECHFQEFFRKVSVYSNLRDIVIESSHLKELWRGTYPKLESLFLKDNDLGELKENFFEFSWESIDCEAITLNNNKLYLLGDTFSSVVWPKSLKHLGLRFNELNKIKEHLAFNNLPKSMKSIILDDNNLDKETIENIKNQLQENGFIIDKEKTEGADMYFQDQNER